MAELGYARVSTSDQTPQPQIDQLAAAGCERIFVDIASGAKTDRPELRAALAYARPGDRLTVVRLDRLGRSLPHLIDTVDGLGTVGVEFRSLAESLDTKTPTGRLIFRIMGSLAEFERELIRERTMAGLAAARAAGRHGGRQPVDDAALAVARDLVQKGRTVSEAARIVRIGRSTLYRYLQES
jgi:DNA invertase Pin-like site-specific DNA recombinase